MHYNSKLISTPIKKYESITQYLIVKFKKKNEFKLTHLLIAAGP